SRVLLARQSPRLAHGFLMRLPEDRIKEAILHPDREIRDRAIDYFAKSFSPDPSVMPLVIRSVQTHPREEAHQLVGASRDLAQSSETIDWVIDELKERSQGHESYPFELSIVLEGADIALLRPREADILALPALFPGAGEAIRERLLLSSWDTATCWRKL